MGPYEPTRSLEQSYANGRDERFHLNMHETFMFYSPGPRESRNLGLIDKICGKIIKKIILSALKHVGLSGPAHLQCTQMLLSLHFKGFISLPLWENIYSEPYNT